MKKKFKNFYWLLYPHINGDEIMTKLEKFWVTVFVILLETTNTQINIALLTASLGLSANLPFRALFAGSFFGKLNRPVDQAICLPFPQALSLPLGPVISKKLMCQLGPEFQLRSYALLACSGGDRMRHGFLHEDKSIAYAHI